MAVMLAACAPSPQGDPSPAAVGDEATDAPASWSGQIRMVPHDHPTIQEAVDTADPGDMVLIERGVYPEEVQVATPGLTIRGVDRNEVVIDGESLRPNGVIAFADGVAVENLTVRGATEAGVVWTGVRGYRASYVTATDNGVHGIDAFDSGDGLFEHSYASGSHGAGFHIGRCDPCEAVITDSLSEWNAVGYSGTNASGDLYLVDSVARHNAVGIAFHTEGTQLLAPVHDVTVAGNLVHDNGNPRVPVLGDEWADFGNGVVLVGSEGSQVMRNRILNHPANGVAIFPDLSWSLSMSADNRVVDNVIEGSGRADIALAGPASGGNCFTGNGEVSTLPVGLEVLQSCSGPRIPVPFELAGSTDRLGRLAESELGLIPEAGPVPDPGTQPQLPQGGGAPVHPAVDVLAAPPDLDDIRLPQSEVGLDRERGVTLFGILFGSAPGVFLGLYAYLLPFVLYSAWVGIALWDLARRDDLGKGGVIAWTAAILLVPFLGVMSYHFFSRSPIPLWHRLTYVLGGIVVYAAIVGAAALVGGII